MNNETVGNFLEYNRAWAKNIITTADGLPALWLKYEGGEFYLCDANDCTIVNSGDNVGELVRDWCEAVGAPVPEEFAQNMGGGLE